MILVAEKGELAKGSNISFSRFDESIVQIEEDSIYASQAKVLRIESRHCILKKMRILIFVPTRSIYVATSDEISKNFANTLTTGLKVYEDFDIKNLLII
ncbi:hypothetical protein V1478_008584 [Vespula squamosa]|uniref:Uncharacterized protein n=1 Tax=Vespula squamosa TaxID=30214 RepID=A0ABD2AUM5_VESSQ